MTGSARARAMGGPSSDDAAASGKPRLTGLKTTAELTRSEVWRRLRGEGRSSVQRGAERGHSGDLPAVRATVGEGLSSSGGARQRRLGVDYDLPVCPSQLRSPSLPTPALEATNYLGMTAKRGFPLPSLTISDEERVTYFGSWFFIWSQEKHMWHGIFDLADLG
uniref:Uncharacterized protein n=1 Tax=Oryza barthii TaxID=65489 RepID=A0A0D3FM53_9ORYZ